MRCITLIVHASSKMALTDLLHGIQEVERFSMSDCEGYDESDLVGSFVSTGDRVIGFIPRVRIEVVVEESAVPSVLEAVREPRTGLAGLGVYWVSPVLDGGVL